MEIELSTPISEFLCVKRVLLLTLWSKNHIHLLAIEFRHSLYFCNLLQVGGETQ